jgi:hypothetical protein
VVDVSQWPEVSYPDIVNYLVNTKSAELKAYKSLQSYNYFISGFVLEIGHPSVNGKSVARQGETFTENERVPLLPWIIAEENGLSLMVIVRVWQALVRSVHTLVLLFAVEAAVMLVV